MELEAEIAFVGDEGAGLTSSRSSCAALARKIRLWPLSTWRHASLIFNGLTFLESFPCM